MGGPFGRNTKTKAGTGKNIKGKPTVYKCSSLVGKQATSGHAGTMQGRGTGRTKHVVRQDTGLTMTGRTRQTREAASVQDENTMKENENMGVGVKEGEKETAKGMKMEGQGV